jgi:hypothetical protein
MKEPITNKPKGQPLKPLCSDSSQKCLSIIKDIRSQIDDMFGILNIH